MGTIYRNGKVNTIIKNGKIYGYANKSNIEILKGTTTPTSAQGNNGEIYLQYQNYIYKSFMNDKIIIRESPNDPTDIKLFFVGFENTTAGTTITDNELLAYFNDIQSGYGKNSLSYDTKTSDTTTGIITVQNQNGTINILTYILGWTQYKAGTFYSMIDLAETAVQEIGVPNCQDNGNIVCDTDLTTAINHPYLKVNNSWQNLIGSDIDDVGNTSETDVPIDMTNITVYRTSSMFALSDDTDTIFGWDSGSQIALTVAYTIPIDVTNISKLKYDLQTRSCWGNGQQALRPSWYLQIGIMSTFPTSYLDGAYSDLDFVAGNYFPNSNTDYGTQEIDVSNLSGDYYLVINAHGWNASIKNLRYE